MFTLLLLGLAALSKFERNNVAKLWRNEAPTKAAGMWVQLHTGDPGVDGTANAAKETKRKQITLSAISEGVMTNENTLEWESVTATEKVTHVSVWDANEGGNHRIFGSVKTAQDFIKEQDARIKPETLKLSFV